MGTGRGYFPFYEGRIEGELSGEAEMGAMGGRGWAPAGQGIGQMMGRGHAWRGRDEHENRAGNLGRRTNPLDEGWQMRPEPRDRNGGIPGEPVQGGR
jgi:hypothetical protein